MGSLFLALIEEMAAVTPFSCSEESTSPHRNLNRCLSYHSGKYQQHTEVRTQSILSISSARSQSRIVLWSAFGWKPKIPQMTVEMKAKRASVVLSAIGFDQRGNGEVRSCDKRKPLKTEETEKSAKDGQKRREKSEFSFHKKISFFQWNTE